MMDLAENFEDVKGDSVFRIGEKRPVALVGCSPLECQKARYLLAEGTDFKKLGRSYFWTLKTARDFASETEGCRPDDIPVIRYDALAEAGVTELVVLTVLRRNTVNPRILLVTDGTRELRVRGKNKVNFRARTIVNWKHFRVDLNELVGNCSRFPGKE